MRNAFAKSITELAINNQDVFLFYADIGNRLFNHLKEVAPDRTINAGIAEANMASMAAGCAMLGGNPFIYTITPFTTARNFEQIKIDIAYQNLPVTIVGTGSGLSYANLGPTHHSFEDIALMRALPNMIIICPSDKQELTALLPQIMHLKQPSYLRIGKKNEPDVCQNQIDVEIGKAHVIRKGAHIGIFSTGTIMPVSVELHDKLKASGIDSELVSFHTVKPLDKDYLMQSETRFDFIITIEEHNKNGGFGSAILEFFNEMGSKIAIKRFGIPDYFIDKVSSPISARNKIGLTANDIFNELKLNLCI